VEQKAFSPIYIAAIIILIIILIYLIFFA